MSDQEGTMDNMLYLLPPHRPLWGPLQIYRNTVPQARGLLKGKVILFHFLHLEPFKGNINWST